MEYLFTIKRPNIYKYLLKNGEIFLFKFIEKCLLKNKKIFKKNKDYFPALWSSFGSIEYFYISDRKCLDRICILKYILFKISSLKFSNDMDSSVQCQHVLRRYQGHVSPYTPPDSGKSSIPNSEYFSDGIFHIKTTI